VVEGRRHHAQEFGLLVGLTGTGRKGSARAQPTRLLKMVSPEWAKHVVSGLSSGEGLIWAVRDQMVKTEPVREGGRVVRYLEVCTDPGVSDKRLFVYEPEFASVLKVMARDGNTLSPVLRAAWDGERVLRTLTKNSPTQATDAHISLVGDITPDELRRLLDRTEVANGFLNRFLLVCARRSKLLPDGGSLAEEDLKGLAAELHAILVKAEGIGEMRRSPAARDLWHEMYPALTAGRPGLLGAVLSRAEAHVLRLSMIYALLDASAVIGPEHLRAARAVWDYCAASAQYVFGDALGDPVGDAILAALRSAGGDGLTRSEIYDLFGRHVSRDRIARTLAQLDGLRLACCTREQTEGRPREVWRATSPR